VLSVPEGTPTHKVESSGRILCEARAKYFGQRDSLPSPDDRVSEYAQQLAGGLGLSEECSSCRADIITHLPTM